MIDEKIYQVDNHSLFFTRNFHHGMIPYSQRAVKVKRAFDSPLRIWIENPMEVVAKKCGGMESKTAIFGLIPLTLL